MILLPIALSLSNTFTKVGAVAAIAALLGIAILSLLVFAQAREIKRLREWAGRAPERAAELEQRITAAARVQGSRAGQMARQVPRAVTGQPQHLGAVGAQPGANAPATAPVAAGAPGVATTPLTAMPPTAPGAAGAPGVAAAPDVAARPLAPPPAQAAPGAAPAVAASAVAAQGRTGPRAPVAPSPPGAPAGVPGSPASAPGAPRTSAQPQATGQGQPTTQAPGPPRPPFESQTPGQPGPAIAARPGATPAGARGDAQLAAGSAIPAATPAAVAASQRSDSRTLPGSPAVEGVSGGGVAEATRPGQTSNGPVAAAPAEPHAPAPATAAAGAAGASAAEQRSATPPRPAMPPAPAPAAARRGQDARRGPEAAAATGSRTGRDRADRRAGSRPRSSGERSSPARTTLLIVGGVAVGAVALVLALTSIGGGSSTQTGTSASSTSKAATRSSAHNKAHHVTPAAPANAGETSVAVLNGTETEGLAHRVSGELKQIGYSQATPVNGRPPGSGQSTVVEYASGHQQEAEAVARTLSVSHVLPVEAGVTALAGSASVVVIVGADRAAAGT